MTAPLIFKNIVCTDSPQLLCFSGVRRLQWIVFLTVSAAAAKLPAPAKLLGVGEGVGVGVGVGAAMPATLPLSPPSCRRRHL